jgi:Cys-rich four helix bundle protein (predicted Tat secretion target)
METNRRGFFTWTARAGLGAWLAPLAAAWAPRALGASAKPSALAEVARTAADCIKAGDACIAHCAKELANGDKEMGLCNEKAHDMVALTTAMLALATAGSAYASQLAPICAAACKDCADACNEHRAHFAQGMHLVCKQCLEACQACAKACQTLG